MYRLPVDINLIGAIALRRLVEGLKPLLQAIGSQSMQGGVPQLCANINQLKCATTVLIGMCWSHNLPAKLLCFH